MKYLMFLLLLISTATVFGQQSMLERAQSNDPYNGEYKYYPYNIVCLLTNLEPGDLDLYTYRETIDVMTYRYEIPYEYDGSAETNWAIINHPIEDDVYNRHKFDYSVQLRIQNQDEDHVIQDFSNPLVDDEWLPVDENLKKL